MCKVKTMREMDKRIILITKNGQELVSEGLNAPGGRSDYIRALEEATNGILKENNLNSNDIDEYHVERITEEDHVYITDHALKRLKQRNGWSKKTSKRMLARIYEQGKHCKDLTGRMKTWIKHKEQVSGDNTDYRIYGEKLYIFDGSTLVTVVNTPRKGSFFNQAKNKNDYEDRKYA